MDGKEERFIATEQDGLHVVMDRRFRRVSARAGSAATAQVAADIANASEDAALLRAAYSAAADSAE